MAGMAGGVRRREAFPGVDELDGEFVLEMRGRRYLEQHAAYGVWLWRRLTCSE